MIQALKYLIAIVLILALCIGAFIPAVIGGILYVAFLLCCGLVDSYRSGRLFGSMTTVPG